MHIVVEIVLLLMNINNVRVVIKMATIKKYKNVILAFLIGLLLGMEIGKLTFTGSL